MNKDKNNISNVFPDNFCGSIDAFLKKMSSVDVDAVECEVELENVAKRIAKEHGIVFSEAVELVREARIAEVQLVVDKLIQEGLLQVVGYDAENEPLYTHTTNSVCMQ